MNCLYDRELNAYGVYRLTHLSEDSYEYGGAVDMLLENNYIDEPEQPLPKSWDFSSAEELKEKTQHLYLRSAVHPATGEQVQVARNVALVFNQLNAKKLAKSVNSKPSPKHEGNVITRIVSTVKKGIRSLILPKVRPTRKEKDKTLPNFVWSYDSTNGTVQISSYKEFYKQEDQLANRLAAIDPYHHRKGIPSLSPMGTLMRALKPSKSTEKMKYLPSSFKSKVSFTLIGPDKEQRLF
jgi:hypothetical protein